MQLDSKILDDIAKLATSVFGNANQMRKEVEESFRARLESMLSGLGVAVNREEFEAMREMVSRLSTRIDEIEKRLPPQHRGDNRT